MTLHTDPHTALFESAARGHVVVPGFLCPPRPENGPFVRDHGSPLPVSNTSSQGNSPEDSETNKRENTQRGLRSTVFKMNGNDQDLARSTSVRKEKVFFGSCDEQQPGPVLNQNFLIGFVHA